MARTLGLLGAIAALLLALPAVAGSMELGRTGLRVTLTPSSLLVEGVSPHSPAALAHIVVARERVVRLRYINGQDALELLDRGGLEAALASDSIMLTLGVRERGGIEEQLQGPFVLDIADSGKSRLQRAVAARRWSTAITLARTSEIDPGLSRTFFDRLELTAEEAARAGHYAEALAIARQLTIQDPIYGEMMSEAPAWRAAMLAEREHDRGLSPRETFHDRARPTPKRLAPPAPTKKDRRSKRRP